MASGTINNIGIHLKERSQKNVKSFSLVSSLRPDRPGQPILTTLILSKATGISNHNFSQIVDEQLVKMWTTLSKDTNMHLSQINLKLEVHKSRKSKVPNMEAPSLTLLTPTQTQ